MTADSSGGAIFEYALYVDLLREHAARANPEQDALFVGGGHPEEHQLIPEQAEREAAEFAAEKEFWRVIGHSPTDDEAWAFQEFEFAVEAKARAAGRAEVEESLRDALTAIAEDFGWTPSTTVVRYRALLDATREIAARALSTSTEATS